MHLQVLSISARMLKLWKVRGPFALCDHAVVKLASKIYGATTVGAHSRVVKLITRYFSLLNKGHDGFRKRSHR
jgi:hypothetical protein